MVSVETGIGQRGRAMSGAERTDELDERSLTLLAVAREFDRDGREAGQKNGPLGHVGREVLQEILENSRDGADGAVFGLSELADVLGRSRNAVTDALARLEKHGFIVKRELPSTDDRRRVAYTFTAILPDKLAAIVDRPSVRHDIAMRRA